MTDRSVDLVVVGETLGLVSTVGFGPLATAHAAHIGIGGAESNVAIAAARLGAQVTWVSRLGQDGWGDKIERTLRGEGVAVVVKRDAARPTGIMVKERRTGSHTQVMYYRAGSAASAIDSSDVSTELLASSKCLHLTGITPALSVTARDAVRSIVDRAHQANTLVSFDINYRSALWSVSAAAEEFRFLLPYVDVLFGGLDELALLDPHIASASDAVAAAREWGINHLVVKDGGRGAHAFEGDESCVRPAFDIDVVDTVGAGDAFVAGYLTATLEGASLCERLERGNRAGALTCMAEGDWEGSPTRAELGMLGRTDPVRR